MFVFGIFNNEKTKHWETNIAVETKRFETVLKQSIGKQTLQWKPNILKPLENKALGTKHCSGNQTFYCSISQNTCLKKVCISPVSDASASARGAMQSLLNSYSSCARRFLMRSRK